MSELPKYVEFDRDRYGKPRLYYRRFGRRIRLRQLVGTPAFLDEVSAAESISLTAPRIVPRKRVRHMSVRASVVYFILHGNKRVKIGFSTCVDRRLSDIQGGLPGKARLLYTTPGDMSLEKSLHLLFAADRVNREWFNYSAAIQDWIRSDRKSREEQTGLGHVAPIIGLVYRTVSPVEIIGKK